MKFTEIALKLFEEYDPNSPHTVEQKLVELWDEMNLLKRVKEKNHNGRRFVFYDGPITANNPMGVHHAWGRTYKDVVQRYKAMKGFDQRFQNGFDTQGLWLEVEVEKALNLGSKKDIVEFGLDNFAQKCKDRIATYSNLQTNQSKALGQMMDWENSYFTHTDSNIETIWHFLKVCHQKGWLYLGHRTMPWCWRCGTSLSKHEQSDSHRLMKHTAVFVKFPLVNRTGALLVWTTTPWTLPANVALAVHPDLEYGLFKNGREIVYAGLWMKERLKDFDLVKKIKGKALVGWKYSHPLATDERELPWRVYAWSEVSANEGTGVVHLAPGCGEEDFRFSQNQDLPFVKALDEQGVYLSGFGHYSGKFYREVNELVVKDLENSGFLFLAEEFEHRYPVCWRCKEELVFRLVNEWFLDCTEVKNLLRAASEKVTWNPPSVGDRFANWLETMGDWCISRKRFWGLPLPFYPCECGHLTVVGSVAELKELAADPTEIEELHRPWIDQVYIRCKGCGKRVSRVPDVGDCWLDAGIMPFSTLNYLNDREYWSKWFPADFVCEMREQVRLWFYSMMFMSVTLTGRPPFKYVFSYEVVKDKFGNPFHKTGPNAIVLDKVLETMGADALRFLYLGQNNALPMKFDTSSKRGNKILRSLYNATKFLVTYSDLDGLDTELPVLHDPLDLWMVEELDSYLSFAETAYENYNFVQLVERTEEFLDDFTNWYLRLSRRDTWNGSPVKRSVIFWTLSNLIKVLAPALPFISELIHQQLRKYDSLCKVSVHLEDFPRCKGRPSTWGSAMRIIQKFAEMGRKLRKLVGVKTRHPLQKALVWLTDPSDNVELLLPLLEQELNVKSVQLLKNPDQYLKYHLVPNYAVAGPLFGKKIREFEKALQNLSRKQVLHWKEGGAVFVTLDIPYKLTKDLVHLKFETRKGFVSEIGSNLAIFLDTKRSSSLVQEGLVRDVIRLVQVKRQERNVLVTQKINLRLTAPANVIEAVKAFEDLLKKETLCLDLELVERSKGTAVELFVNPIPLNV